MALPTTMELPTYCVYREIRPDGSVDLAAPLHFFPPLGSDELFDALRSKFPHLKSHSERVGQASMQFFLEEDLSQFPTPLAPPSSTNVSPWEPSLPSFCSETSAWSSPDAFDPATPHSSPLSHPLSRQQSMATSATAPTSATPPALERMTSVFTLADYPQPKQHVRRKMTDQEKADYRQRRLAKACEKCAKRKRKVALPFSVSRSITYSSHL
ncbi:hypothetical protein BDY17DRAFT_311096 [Neohortaea acidophila]|uniref:Uncharacterized protein n=1 Tax=Neohortaea acidophila TaxID=245834 RepID=A0A6A6PS98_9PEZI|nr:uncharacterized protein BDY17DRAFT_311096 [Neohortaea acidophila]KAF2482656.1 hypothetical protein BDY17DRAFT_311096 [Neohortaea acidophila]